MDVNADTAVADALARTRGIIFAHVITLDRAKVTKIMLEDAEPPAHALTSEKILRHDLAGETPHFFITLVSGDAKDWFAREYLPATGIDVNAEPFDHARISREYVLGLHRLLLLSAHAGASVQRRVISKFIGRCIRDLKIRHLRHTAAYWQRAGHISAPLSLLDGQKQDRQHMHLKALDRALHAPWPLSDRAVSRAYAPKDRAILYNAHQTLPYHTSGYATRTHGLVSALHKLGWDMHVVARAGYPADTHITPTSKLQTIDGVPYHVNTASGQGQWDLPLDKYIDSAARHICAQAAVLKPGLIHTASNYICGLAGVEAARRLGIPSIYEMRGLWHISKWAKEPGYNDTERFALAQKMELETAAAADHVIAITGALKEWLTERCIDPGKISVAPNAVDTMRFTPQPRDDAFAREHGCQGKIVIGYFGSFTGYEGLDLLLRAVALLPHDMRAQIKLLWMGDGPVLNDLLALAATLHVADVIVSLGRRPFDDVPRAYSITDICVFPRKALPVCEIVSPLKPFEAMAMEKTLIVSDVRPLAEIVHHDVTGLVHAKDDAVSLSQQLARAIGDPHLRESCGRAAGDWVRKTRHWDIIATDVAQIYKDLT